MVYEILKEGREQALGMEYLKNLLGFSSARSLRKQIELERRAGHLILSSCGEPSGYYRPKSLQEVKDYVRMVEARARGSLFTLKAARECLAEWEGQQALEIEDGKEEAEIQTKGL